nr:DUF3488 and DUF4129 domain-containing transglutaminase family protein [Motiliproteus sp. SC1-56]
MTAMFAGMAPHLTRLPIWVTLVCLLCGFWRIMVYRERWRLPGRLIRTLLVFSGGAAVVGHYGTLAGPEAGTALLVLGFCFKLLETHSRRDAFVVVILGYFVVATSFFFDQDMASAAYLLLVCFMVTAALVGLNQSPLQTQPRRTAGLALRLLAQSLPLMLVLFLFVPRVGPIWSLNLGENRATTGISDRITPGDIAELSRSSALAFRVAFDGGIPAARNLYWRGLTLNHYDGATWSRGPVDLDEPPWLRRGAGDWLGAGRGQPLGYRVMLEPTDQRWLFALAAARSTTPGVGYSRDHRLVKRSPVSQPFAYEVDSFLRQPLDPNLPDWLARVNLQLPETGDPRTRALAEQLAAEAGSPSALVERALAWFRARPFSYTLRPPTLSGDRNDQFLFQTRRGFCSHYAGAFVYLMRSAGVPARIVAGYQGGERNPLGNYLLVHQFDAHAWAEVWLAGQGWVRVDPTTVVAPERVEQGIEEALAGEGSFLEDSPLAPARYRDWAWVSRLRLGLDYLNFAWHRSVLGYNAQYQSRLLARWFGDVDFKRLGLLMAVSVALLLGALAGWLLWQGSQPLRSPLVREYRRLCRRLAPRGQGPEPGEAPATHLLRLQEQRPDQATSLAAMAALLQQQLYAGSADPGAVRRFRRLGRGL